MLLALFVGSRIQKKTALVALATRFATEGSHGGVVGGPGHRGAPSFRIQATRRVLQNAA